jgi:protein-arginine kinase activator protein McsA
MTKESGTEETKNGEVCSWCGSSFELIVRQKQVVCARCYRLLASAGLKDEEIFADKNRKEDERADEV